MERRQPGSQLTHTVLGPGCTGKHTAPGCDARAGAGRITAGALVWVTRVGSSSRRCYQRLACCFKGWDIWPVWMSRSWLLCWRGDNGWLGRRATGMAWGGRSEGAARGELSGVPPLLWDQRREGPLGAATLGACCATKCWSSAERRAKRLPAAPGDATAGGGRTPWVLPALQLPGGCFGMG